MNSITKERAEKVAQWWADRTFASDNQGTTGSAKLDYMINYHHKESDQPTESQILKFKESITQYLISEKSGDLELIVDYHPNDPLAIACVVADIDTSLLPRKTFSLYRAGEFIGRNGYGSDFEKIA